MTKMSVTLRQGAGPAGRRSAGKVPEIASLDVEGDRPAAGDGTCRYPRRRSAASQHHAQSNMTLAVLVRDGEWRLPLSAMSTIRSVETAVLTGRHPSAILWRRRRAGSRRSAQSGLDVDLAPRCAGAAPGR